MQLGLFMMPLHPPHRAVADCYDRDIDQLVVADRAGFAEVWLGEHFTEKWENAPAPDLLLAKALALTGHIRLGTGVKQRIRGALTRRDDEIQTQIARMAEEAQSFTDRFYADDENLYQQVISAKSEQI